MTVPNPPADRLEFHAIEFRVVQSPLDSYQLSSTIKAGALPSLQTVLVPARQHHALHGLKEPTAEWYVLVWNAKSYLIHFVMEPGHQALRHKGADLFLRKIHNGNNQLS